MTHHQSIRRKHNFSLTIIITSKVYTISLNHDNYYCHHWSPTHTLRNKQYHDERPEYDSMNSTCDKTIVVVVVVVIIGHTQDIWSAFESVGKKKLVTI